MGCGGACLVISGKGYLTRTAPDSTGLPLDAARLIRNDIARRGLLSR